MSVDSAQPRGTNHTYESFNRSIGASNFRRAASLAAAICYMRPLREIGEPNSRSQEMSFLNQRCALNAIAKLLGIRPKTINAILPNSDDSKLFESSFLNSLVKIAADRFPDETTILSINCLPNYHSYNESNDVAWCDIHYLERLMNAITLMISDA